MRSLCFLLAVASAGVAQQAPPPPPPAAPGTTLKGPAVPGDALGFSVELDVKGRILMENRQAPPEPVPVDWSCRGATLTVPTDVKGRFSVPVGRQQVARSSTLATALPALEGCRVRVRVPGFEEIAVTLKRARSASELDLGDRVLKSAAGQAAAVFSEASRAAPNKARANYLRAMEQIGQNRYPEAIAYLDKATGAFPAYASAYQLKGQVLEVMGQPEQARAAYRQAASADPGYVKPLVQLAELAAQEQNAAEAAEWAAKVNGLAPGVYPSIYLLEGTAYFHLDRVDDAIRAARAGIAADPAVFFPNLRKVLGEALYRKRDYAGAREQFETYLKFAPEAADAPDVKARVEACAKLSRLK